MKISSFKWSIFFTSILVFQLLLTSFCLINFSTNISLNQNETTFKQLGSYSQAIEETESLFVTIQETKEDIELNHFSIDLNHVLNFSSKSWFEFKVVFDSKNFSSIPYSPPEKIS